MTKDKISLNYTDINLNCNDINSIFFSDPYVKIVLYRGDRDSGIIETVQTKTIKKVKFETTFSVLSISVYTALLLLVPKEISDKQIQW